MPDDKRRRLTLTALAAVSILAVLASLFLDDRSGGSGGDGGSAKGTATSQQDDARTTEPAEPEQDPDSFTSDYDGWVDPESSGHPYPNATVEGLLTFRGNPTRSYYGKGPVPGNPSILYSFPDAPMCHLSTDLGTTTTWCGMGWTGQPTVFEREGTTWAIFGGYDAHLHFMDTANGQRLLPDLETGDIIKGTPTVDPEGFPLVYFGSRDNYLRVVAFDRAEPTVLWKLHADDVSPVKWNDDWDSSPAIVGDYLFEGGENSQLHIVKLNRKMGSDGKVTVDPQLVFNAPSWDDELIAALAGFDKPQAFSVENSVAIVGDVVYFGNSAGLIQGWSIKGLDEGTTPKRVFRFWAGDDTDASVVADDEGFLYVGAEYERGTQRSKDVGQLVKLDPSKPDDPIVWSVPDQGVLGGGIWSTPAIHDDVLYVGTNGGRLIGVDRETGAVRWTKHFEGKMWGSPAVVDDTLLVGDCAGVFHAWDVSDTTIDPPERWSVSIGGCLEATPAVWKGKIYIGSRAGKLYVLGDPPGV